MGSQIGDAAKLPRGFPDCGERLCLADSVRQLGVWNVTPGSSGLVNRVRNRVVESALLYDVVQWGAGIGPLRSRLCPTLSALDAGTLLDVGAGTGAFLEVVPKHVRYTPLDIDEAKLERLHRKHGIDFGVVASGGEIPFPAGSFDYTLCTNVAHHLTDAEFDALVAELARVTRRELVFLDAVRADQVASRLLWRLDRGTHPRVSDTLVTGLTRYFDSQRVEMFTVRHTYLLFVGRPRSGPRQAAYQPNA